MSAQLYDKKYFRASKKFQANNERLENLVDIIASFKPQNVLDVGCGRGFLVQHLRWRGISATGTDWSSDAAEIGIINDIVVANATSLPFKDKAFDVVVSTDFLEHIPKDGLNRVVLEMHRVGKRVLGRIAFDDDKHKRNLYHLTVESPEWWREQYPDITQI